MAKNDNAVTNTNTASAREAVETARVATSTVAESTAMYSQEEQYTVKLISELTAEAGSSVTAATASGSAAEKAGYQKLHHAFRLLVELRGQAFVDGFAALIENMTKYRNGIYRLEAVSKHLDLFTDAAERESFVVFINTACRFARSTNKQHFSNGNNIARVQERFVDPELQALIASVFLAQ